MSGFPVRSRRRPLHPSAVLVGSFAAAILAGALALALPVAATSGSLRLVDALFTATSAVCVTGLTVVDTGTAFTGFGQGVILVLIQAGGLGIMTFSVFFTLLLGRSISIRDRLLVQDTLHPSPGRELRALVGHILGFTFAMEALGALLLFARWHGDHPAGRAAYLSAFHAISAFCNAGFSLFPDSLIGYRGDATVNLVVTGLVIVGGLGFLVNIELLGRAIARLRERPAPRLSLHARVVLATSAGLLVLGFVGFLAGEWNNLLAGLPLSEKLWAAWFQGVTPRTAGFNTVDYAHATSATLLFTMPLMFVGASPGSTGGGVKTTSLGLMLALVWARWRGRGRAWVFRRTIPFDAMDRALTLSLLSWALVLGALFALLLAEQGAVPHGPSDPDFLVLMFEAISAFGTVGLSTGVTPHLSDAGKLLITALMFVGRVGPLTLILAVGRRQRGEGHFRYAEEGVMVG